MIKYFVRTTNERELDSSYNQIEYELLIDTEHKPNESFVKQLGYISKYDSVLLEDDLILCRDFKNRIEAVISQYSDKIIQFFTAPGEYFTTHLSNGSFAYNQCTYYPKGLSGLIAKGMSVRLDNKYRYGYDVIEHWVLKQECIPHLRYRPCLVQHIDYKSLISPGIYPRRTPYFIDYLEELNIDYLQAYTKENKEKLIEYMKAKFEEN